MQSFKELIKNKNFFTFFLSLFIFMSGVLILLLGFVMFFTINTLESGSNNTTMPIVTSIFGIILIGIGYIIPKLIIKNKNIADDERQKCDNEKKKVIQSINGIRLATDTEKQDYIMDKNLKNDISFPTMLLIGMVLCFAFVFILVGLVQEEAKTFLFFTGIVFLAIGIIIFYIQKNKNSKIIKKIMNCNIYVANCYAYDRKTEKIRINNPDHVSHYDTIHLIKVTDGNYFVEKWFSVGYKDFYNETLKAKLYISNEMDIYDIVIDI